MPFPPFFLYIYTEENIFVCIDLLSSSNIMRGIQRLQYWDIDHPIGPAMPSEKKTSPPNNKSARGFPAVDAAKAALEDACPAVVSCESPSPLRSPSSWYVHVRTCMHAVQRYKIHGIYMKQYCDSIEDVAVAGSCTMAFKLRGMHSDLTVNSMQLLHYWHLFV